MKTTRRANYRNDLVKPSIQLDRKIAPHLRRIFELYSTGEFTLSGLRHEVEGNSGFRISKARLVQVLRNPFYAGRLICGKHEYKGRHPRIVEGRTYAKVQRILNHEKCGLH
jgi:hypothetical protein